MADKNSEAAGKKSERDERLAKALRENLRRRKAGVREIAASEKKDAPPG
jgi:hypothetical protein